MTRLIALLALAAPPTDQFGDPLPAGAIARFGTVRFGVGREQIRHSHALSPDGKFLAVEDYDGIALWDIETGKIAKRLPWRTSQGDFPKFALAFSADGKFLARLAGRVVAMWDLATGEELFDVDLYERGKCQGIAWVPGKEQVYVTSADHAKAWILDARTGKIVKTIEFDMKYPLLVPKGPYVLGFVETNWKLFEPATGREVARFPGDFGADGESFELTPDGKQAWLVARNGRLRRYESATGKQIEELPAPAKWDYCRTRLAIAPEASVVYLAQSNRAVHRWDVAARRWLAPISDAPAREIIPHPDGKRLLTIGFDGVLRRYDLATGEQIPGVEGFSASVYAYASPEGTRVVIESGMHDRSDLLNLFEISGKSLWSRQPQRDDWGRPHWSSDGRKLICVNYDRVNVRDPAHGFVSRTLSMSAERLGDFDGMVFVPTAPDRVIASFDKGQTLAEFNLATGDRTRLWRPNLTNLRDLSPDGCVVVYNDLDHGLRLFDLAANKVCTDWIDPPNADAHISAGMPCFSPDGSYLLTWELEPQRQAWRSRDSMAVLRHPRTGERKAALETGLGGGFVWAFSPDGLWFVATVGRGAFAVFEMITGQQVEKREGHRDSIPNIQFAGPGRVLTSSADLTALLWDIRPKKRPSKPLWEALSGTDAKEAWRAIWALAADPKAPELLRSEIVMPAAPPADKVKQWLAELGADKYAVREAATKNLQELGRLVEPELKAARGQAKVEEVRTRLDSLLAKIAPERSATEIVHARAVAALEAAGTADARKLLTEWSAGPSGAWLTKDARSALARMALR
ncbi:MAG TPA: WD40 repeat domain-containing protein [Gemmataceae bacterium]|jgi:WD40 repeat protein|nr:WD40 repeat domain-containing protein [Gemmataceae bacterium]